MRKSDKFKTLGHAPKPRSEAQKAADAKRSEDAARARKKAVERKAKQKAAERARRTESQS